MVQVNNKFEIGQEVYFLNAKHVGTKGVVEQMMSGMQLTEGERAQMLVHLKELYTYDTERGALVNRRTGRVIKGALKYNGYLGLSVRLKGKQIKVHLHRIVWAIVKGQWPKMCIDHVNGNKTDNRIGNLREASRSENERNKLLPWRLNAQTGLPGVSAYRSRFCSTLWNKTYWFRSPHEAFFHSILSGKRYKL